MDAFSNESTYKKFLEQGDEQRFDLLFDGALEKAKREVFDKKFPAYIDGKAITAEKELIEYSPIDGMLIGRFQYCTRDDARKAVDAALNAFSSWSKTDYRERAAIMRKAADLFRKQKFLIAAIMSVENGKTRYESVGEVDEAIDFLNYYAYELEKNKGYGIKKKIGESAVKVSAGFQGAPGNSEQIFNVMKPYGVFGVIAPFNFPISISTGMSSAALITGNTVVFKPSSTDNMTMLTGLYIYKIFEEAGVPPGVFNYITGPGSELGDELVSNPKVKGIVFTGSKKTGFGMMAKSYGLGLHKTFIVELGGKDPAIVSKSADLDTAVEGILSSAFGYSGQKCSACSRVYVQESVKEEFISKLSERTRNLRIGNPLVKENYVGPLISQKSLIKFNESVAEAEAHGRIICGGKVADAGVEGIYVEPTIAEIDHSNRLFHEELFIPFLVTDSYKDFSEAIAKANDTEYGLTAGLYSKNRNEISEFLKKIESGVVYVNRKIGATTGAMVGSQVFVGWKGSGTTGKGTGGRFYLQQFLQEQSQTVAK